MYLILHSDEGYGNTTDEGRGKTDEPFLQNQHRIAIAEESVAFLNGFLVGLHYQFSTCKGTDKHQQGTSGKVVIRQQPLNAVEREAGTNEKICIP